MRKEQFFGRHQNNSISQKELERKWNMYMREQEEMRMIFEAARSASAVSAAAAGGASGETVPVAIQEFGESVFFIYKNSVLANYHVVTLDFTSGTITAPVDTNIPNDYYYSYSDMIAGKGIMYTGDDLDGKLWYVIIDGGGNLVESQKGIEIFDGWNLNSNEGMSLSLSYRENEDPIFTVIGWTGDVVRTYKITVPFESNQGYAYFNYFSADAAFLDGTFNAYIYDSNSANRKIFLLKPDGTSTEIQDIWDSTGMTYVNNSYMHMHSGIIWAIYRDDATNDYLFIRVWAEDGTYVDHVLDPAKVYTSRSRNAWGKGYPSAFFWKPFDNTVPWHLVTYTKENGFQSLDIDKQVYTDYEVIYRDSRGDFGRWSNSAEGTETLMVAFYNEVSYSNGMSECTDLKIVYQFGEAPLNYYDADTSGGNFKIAFPSNQPPVVPMLYCMRPGQTYLELMTVSGAGTTFGTLPTLVADAGSYFQVQTIGGNYTMATHYDNSRTGDVQMFQIYQNGAPVDAPVWMSIMNGWNYYGKMLWIYNSDTDTFYYFTPAIGFIKQEEGTSSLSNYFTTEGNGWGDLTTPERVPTNEVIGTLLLEFSNGSCAFLRPDFTNISMINEQPVTSYFARRFTEDYLYYLYQDAGNSDIYTWQVYDLEWNLLNTVPTNNDTYADYAVISERAWMTQYTGDGDLHTFMIKPESYVESSFFQNFYNFDVNDYRWWC